MKIKVLTKAWFLFWKKHAAQYGGKVVAQFEHKTRKFLVITIGSYINGDNQVKIKERHGFKNELSYAKTIFF